MNNYGQGNFSTANQQYNSQAPAVERDPDGLCNLLSQSVDRASVLNESLAKLNQHMSAVLLPEPPEPATTTLGGVGTGSIRSVTSHAHDCLHTIMMRLEQAERQISNIAARFKG